MVKQRILLISPPESYRIQPYIRAAHSLNVEVLLASEGEWAISHPDSAGINVPLHDQQRALGLLENSAQQHHIDAVIGTDDSTLELAARLAQRIGLQQNNPTAVRLARRKDLSRSCLQQAGIPVPEFTLIDCSAEQPVAKQPEFGFPCVIKPLALSASR